MSGSSSIANVLDRAANLIEPEGKWTQGALAKDADGFIVDPFDPTAVCFCALGSIDAVIGDFYGGKEASRALQSVVPQGHVGSFNDDPSRTQAEVVAKLREAAAFARRQAQS